MRHEYHETVWETNDERVRLYPDTDTGDESPRDWTNVGVMACAHRRYDLGDSSDLAGEVEWAIKRKPLSIVARWLRIFHGATVVLPLGLYDHGGISMWVGSGAHWSDPGGWDSGTVGLLWDTPEGREKTGVPLDRIEEALRSEVQVYDSWIRGDVWVAVHEKRETWTNTRGETRDDWEEQDAVHGIIGSDSAKETAKSYFPEPEPTKV